jgi:hypothetical protein
MVGTPKPRRGRIAGGPLVFGAAVLLVVGGIAVATAEGVGPLAGSGPATHSAIVATTPATTSPAIATPTSHVPTSTTQSLRDRRYTRGDCVTWDQASTASDKVTKIVDCAQPHLMEFVATRDITHNRAFPTDDEWKQFLDTTCRPLVESYLNHPLDPFGRYVASGLKPLPDGWAQGYRDVHCGIFARPVSPGPSTAAFSGRAGGAEQQLTYRVGTCVAANTGPVECASPHGFEVTGVVDLAGKIDHAPAQGELPDAVRDECVRLAIDYLGRPLSGDLQWGWTSIKPESWAAGTQSANCIVGHADGTAWRAVRGSIRDGA